MKGVFPLQGAVTRSTRMSVTTVLALVIAAIAFAAPAAAQSGPPWDGNPVSHGLGPTYGEDVVRPCDR